MQDLKELIGKKVQGARGEGVITAIDVKGNIEVDYGGKNTTARKKKTDEAAGKEEKGGKAEKKARAEKKTKSASAETVKVKKSGEITFLYKIKDGPMEKSYGINVAQLANLPEELINRSKTILNALEEKKIDYDSVKVSIDSKKEEKDDIIRKEIEKINPLNLSPLEALNVLFELKKKAEIK